MQIFSTTMAEGGPNRRAVQAHLDRLRQEARAYETRILQIVQQLYIERNALEAQVRQLQNQNVLLLEEVQELRMALQRAQNV